MKKLIFAIAALCTAATMSAQLPDGSIAPEWTGVDINGNTHVLYDELNAGKSVIMDVSATWCGPCWAYHTAGTLETVWEEHGPDGTDDVRIYMFEGDESTTQADLEGTGGNTTGDWITGTGYPIIDDASINTPYAIGYYPTIYTICPSGELVETGQISADAHWDYIAQSCASADFDVDASIISYLGSTEICGNTYQPAVRIINLSGDGSNLTSCAIETYVDGTLDNTLDWNGDLALYGTEDVTLPTIDNVTSDITIDVVINYPGDMQDDNNSTSANIALAQEGAGLFQVSILTDNYGGETSWEIVDQNGGILAAVAEGEYASNTQYDQTVSLPAEGCYSFNIYDSYGDGICCAYGDGAYSITDGNGTVLAAGGEFADSESSIAFMSNIIGVNEIAAEDFSIFPNPASSVVNVNLTNSLEDFQVTVLNTVGQVVMIQNFNGDTNFALDIDGLSPGTYMMQINNESVSGTKRFTVK